MGYNMLVSLLTLGGLGILFGFSLAIFHQKMKVEVNPLLKEVIELLPGTNCGACGNASCEVMAEGLVKGKREVSDCPIISQENLKKINKLLGKETVIKEKKVAVLLCSGGKKERKEKFRYSGLKECASASILFSGPLSCFFGCIGFGDCLKSCPFSAIRMNENGIPEVDPQKCTGCGKCVEACPLNLFSLVPKGKVYVACSSKDRGPLVKKECTTGCFGCGKCLKVCEPKAITLENFLAKIDLQKCNNCGKCIEVCPVKVIHRAPG